MKINCNPFVQCLLMEKDMACIFLYIAELELGNDTDQKKKRILSNCYSMMAVYD